MGFGRVGFDRSSGVELTWTEEGLVSGRGRGGGRAGGRWVDAFVFLLGKALRIAMPIVSGRLHKWRPFGYPGEVCLLGKEGRGDIGVGWVPLVGPLEASPLSKQDEVALLCRQGSSRCERDPFPNNKFVQSVPESERES
ncbi:hypothetical protein HAX54_047015 [Datura stramonium]|uniref:Uncharacterized protein n=1 Tax=Datura stramonium TaxID=4076 RepID=A0ABS8WKJ3_DATST|nr:hypothetical protein [Datura stramonium]